MGTMEKENEKFENLKVDECPLSVFTPDTLISKYSNLKDCSESMIDLIKTVQINQKNIKKLCKVFCSLNNCNTDAIVELTKDKNRTLRHISTYLVFGKIKKWIVDGKGFETIEKFYDEVFLPRFRDVDFNIRILCIEFMTEWIFTKPKTFNNPTYTKYIGWGLSDKNDSVRRKAVTGCIQLVSRSIDLKKFIERFKKRICELSISDKNEAIRNEGSRLVFLSFLNNLIDENSLFDVLKNFSNKDDPLLKNLILVMVSDKNGKDLYEYTHMLLKKTNPMICINIAKITESISDFLNYLIGILKKKGGCCNSDVFCYFELLELLKVEVKWYLEVLEIIKDSESNILGVLKCLESLDKEEFKINPDATNKIVEKLRELSFKYESEKIFSNYVKFLSKLNEDFSPLVNTQVQFFTNKNKKFNENLIKYFDISDHLTSDDTNISKTYAMLWKIVTENYNFVDSIEFSGFPELELCDFLIYFNEKCKEWNSEYENPEKSVDMKSSLKIGYKKLHIFIGAHLEALFNNSNNILILFKLQENNLFTDYSYLLFAHADEEFITEMFNVTKNRINLLKGYFLWLSKLEDGNNLEKISKIVAAKCRYYKKQISEDKFLFSEMKAFVAAKKTHLYDTALVYFISYLNSNEKIVLEEKVEKSKFKAALAKRGKETIRSSPTISPANETVIG